jgi:nucleotide-binding universal stress UspA family protein
MYRSILVAMALDHDLSPGTLALARALLAPEGRITALHVLPEPMGSATARLGEEFIKRGRARAESLFQEKLRPFPEAEAVLTIGHTSRTILEEAEKRAADCIVLGSHRPGLADYLLGSTAGRVVRHARCSVHVYRG